MPLQYRTTGFDQRAFRTAMGQFPTGVTVVTGLSDGQPIGFVAQSFVSLSLEPPLVAVCPGRQSTTWPRLREGGAYAVNVLAEDQQALCERFARSGGDKFEGVDWQPGEALGLPLMPGALLQVECRLAAEHEAGDHWIAVGAVAGFGHADDGRAPLVFFRGGFPALTTRPD